MITNIYEYTKAQIGMQAACKIFVKNAHLPDVNSAFSQKFYMRDAPNMSFS